MTKVIFEIGLYDVAITSGGSFATWRPADDLTPQDLRASRQIHTPGTPMSVSVGKQPARGIPAPPEAMRAVFQARSTSIFSAAQLVARARRV
jgi:hypothetical protein